jgi:hypothetical protein
MLRAAGDSRFSYAEQALVPTVQQSGVLAPF